MNLKIACAALISTVFIGSVCAQTIPSVPHIVVNGHAERVMIPDEFILPIQFSETSKDASTLASVENQTLALITKLKALGISDNNITAENISIDKEYNDDGKFIGNQFRRNLSIKFHSKPLLVQFLSSIGSSKNLEIGSIERSMKDLDAIKFELINEAASNSKLRAEKLASLFGMKVIGVHTISSTPIYEGLNSSQGRTLDAVMVSGNRIKKRDKLPPIEQLLQEGEIEISENIYAVFLIGK